MNLKSYYVHLFALAVILGLAANLTAQSKRATSQTPSASQKLSLEQQDALDLLKSVARELKQESDKPAAALLQARIACALWTLDEPFARDVFRWGFETAQARPPEDLSKPQLNIYLTREAGSLREVLKLLSLHDKKLADDWLKSLEEQKDAEAKSTQTRFQSQILVEMALQIVSTNPQQAQQLGLRSLAGTEVPEGFGRLLFALANVDASLSDVLFRAAISTMRRNGFVYDSTLLAVTNYLSSTHQAPSAADADGQLLADYFVDAAWRQPRTAGVPLSTSCGQFYSFLAVRAFSIVARYRADRLAELRGQMAELARSMTAEQAEQTEMMRNRRDDQSLAATRDLDNLEEQIEKADKLPTSASRDALFARIVHSMMRQNPTRALELAAKIDDQQLRGAATDDVNLVRIHTLLTNHAYEEAKEITLKLNNVLIQTRVLAQLASKILVESKDVAAASDPLSKACDLVAAKDNTPNKAAAYLIIAQQFARFDSTRAIECLNKAIKTVNNFKVEATDSSVLSKPRLLTFKSYTMIDGNEMSSSDEATVDAIDFHQITALAAADYAQMRMLGNDLQKPLWRAKYLTTVALAILPNELSSLRH